MVQARYSIADIEHDCATGIDWTAAGSGRLHDRLSTVDGAVQAGAAGIKGRAAHS
jgi:hypothetical protein